MFLSKLKSSFLESHYLIDPKWQTLLGIVDYSTIWAILFAFYSFSDARLSLKGNLIAMVACTVCILISACLLQSSLLGVKIFRVLAPVTILFSLYFTHYVKFSHLPQLVAFYHALVGIGAWCIEILNIYNHFDHGLKMSLIDKTITILGTVVACVTITGSFVAAAKLHGISIPSFLSRSQESNLLLSLLAFEVFLMPLCCYLSTTEGLFICSMILGSIAALAFGFVLINAIDGSNMPVMMSMLNATSGITTLAAGVSLENTLLITIGAYIAATGTVLSKVMCNGMNRTLTSLLLEPMLRGSEPIQLSVKGMEACDRVMMRGSKLNEIYVLDLVQELYAAESILIVPGYGLATAKAHFALGQLIKELKRYGKRVGVVIHPVAGRMPGHLNVLLAEASVPYDLVHELTDITTSQWDLCLVIGANDIVNPSALEEGNPAYGMPLVKVWEADRTVIIKRSLATGFAGLQNPLFYYPGTSMLFKDAKETLLDLCGTLQSVFGPPITKADEIDDSYRKAIKDFQRKIERQAKLSESQSPAKVLSVGVLAEYGEEFLLPLTNVNMADIDTMGVEVIVLKEHYKHYREDIDGIRTLKIAETMRELLTSSDVILCVDINDISEIDFTLLKPVQMLVFNSLSMSHTVKHREAYEKSSAVTIDMAKVPRHTAAQPFDIRSAAANLRGYRAIISAFYTFDGFAFSATTASASLDAAVVLVIGCGIAGLQAIRASKSLGALVFGHDTRLAAKAEVESLGARFISLSSESVQTADGYAKEMTDDFYAKQKKMLEEFLPYVDVVVLTAQLPNKPSPQLISKELVAKMKPSSLIVDMGINSPATIQSTGWGGNCELSTYDSICTSENNVRIVAYKDYALHSPLTMRTIQSYTYMNLIKQIIHDDIFAQGELNIKKSLLLQAMTPGSVSPMEAPRTAITSTAKANNIIKEEVNSIDDKNVNLAKNAVIIILVMLALLTLGSMNFIRSLHSLGMGLVIGTAVVWVVNPKLHTPLMSFTNAISGIIVIGSFSFLQRESFIYMVLAQVSVICNLINICGGFYITTRMLSVFEAST